PAPRGGRGVAVPGTAGDRLAVLQAPELRAQDDARRRPAIAAGEEGAPGRVQAQLEMAVERHRDGHPGREGPPSLTVQGEELVGAVAACPARAEEVLSQEVTPGTDRPVVLPDVEGGELAARWAGGALGAELGAPVDACARWEPLAKTRQQGGHDVDVLRQLMHHLTG